MKEILEIKEHHRRQYLQSRHETALICPICKIIHVTQFTTAYNIKQRDLEKLIAGIKQNYYHNHVLDCNELK